MSGVKRVQRTDYKGSALLLVQLFSQIREFVADLLASIFDPQNHDLFIRSRRLLSTPDSIYQVVANGFEIFPALFLDLGRKFPRVGWRLSVLAHNASIVDRPAVMTVGSTPTVFPPSDWSAVLIQSTVAFQFSHD